MTRKRIIDPQRLNLYGYVRNNPLRFIDPKGEDVYLANEDGGGRTKALLKITKNLTTEEQRNVAYRKTASGKYEIYLKDPSKFDPQKASAGYKHLTNLINNKDLKVNFTLVGDGLRTASGTPSRSELVNEHGGGVTVARDSQNIDVYVAEGKNNGVKGLTQSGRETPIDFPDYIVAAHELFGETLKYTPGNQHLQNNILDDNTAVIDIENEVRKFHGLPLRSYRGHVDLGEEVIVTP